MDLFPKALAQTLDEIASPTIPFTPPPGGGTVTPTPTAPTGPSISLSTSQFTIGINERIKIQVIINTKSTEIKEYGFQITYDPTLLLLVDADSTQSGTQITIVDSFFDITENSGTQATGIINLKAVSDQGSITFTDRVVAEFEFTGIKEGLGEVALNRQNSLLLNNNSTDILESVNSLSVTVTQQGQPTTPTPSLLPSVLPENALIDEIGTPRAIMLGLLLIASGIYLFRYRSRAKSKRIH
jgi:hypothetical protein